MERSASHKSHDAGMQKPSDRALPLGSVRGVQGGWGRTPASPQQTTAGTDFVHTQNAPCVRIAGDIDHPDFRDSLELLGAAANLTVTNAESPELIVIAQSRSSTFPLREVEALHRAAPLAGVVALAGTWCEGEPRTGHPWPGVQRLYWYEFPAWWQRQLAIRSAGQCPDWARPANPELRIADCGLRNDPAAPHGTVVIDSPVRETANALNDVLCRKGYTTIWQRGIRSHGRFRGAIAGVWDAGQLSDHESRQLSQFCRRLSADGAPVVALLDFPRRDRVDQAVSLGAAAVLGKPWHNADLISTLQVATTPAQPRRAA